MWRLLEGLLFLQCSDLQRTANVRTDTYLTCLIGKVRKITYMWEVTAMEDLFRVYQERHLCPNIFFLTALPLS